ncbi:MAG: glycerol-3-phosphate 1-O-acyltransferase PlsY [Anaerolineae bacterium]
MDALLIVRVVVGAYLIGAFPTAYLVGRLNGINIFEVGSGNMGTNNAIRAMGFGWGIVVWAVDIAKGILAVWLAMQALPNGVAQVTGALAAIAGHNWSIFAALLTGKLRGGKGAATWLGTFLVMAPLPVILFIAVLFVVIVALTRYVSLGVLTSVAVGALAMILLAVSHVEGALGVMEASDLYVLYGVLAAVMIFYRHRDNIQRLLSGTERRLGERA